MDAKEGLGAELLTAAGASDLSEALERLITTSRSARGRDNLGKIGVLQQTLRLIPVLAPRNRLVCSLCIKLIRNLCAGDAANQENFIRQNGVEIICELIATEEYGQDPGIVRFGLQVLGNASLAGEMHKTAVWRGFVHHGFAVLQRQRRKEICDPLCMLLYSCIDGIPGQLDKLRNDLGFHALLSEILRTVSSVELEEDWLKLLLSRICLEQPDFPLLFSSIRFFSSESSGVRFSAEQSCLLRLVSEILNDRITEIAVFEDFALFVLEIFKASAALLHSISRGESRFPSGVPEIDVLGYSLRILRDICAQDVGTLFNQERVDVVNKLLATGLVELFLSLLRDLELPATIRKAMRQNENKETGDEKCLRVCPYRGFRSDILAVIANCTYRRKQVQDYIREQNGVLLLLQHCVTDEDNPYLREWGIWCLRNLLEENQENQRIVAELEVQDTINVPELAGLNLKVEIDELTRRAKLVNIPAQDGSRFSSSS